jgi:hypothetical protein
MKTKTITSIITLTIVITLVLLVMCIVAISFKDTMTVPQSYCEHSGGQWNFYECYNAPLVTPSCAERKTGMWCDYPDGTSKSEEDIEYIFNSTEIVLT